MVCSIEIYNNVTIVLKRHVSQLLLFFFLHKYCEKKFGALDFGGLMRWSKPGPIRGVC